MKLYYHPISSYSQKTIMAFHEKNVKFEPHVVNLMDPAAKAEFEKVYPLGKVPVLVREDGWMIPESSIIIEFLDTHFDSGTRLIPTDKDLARQTRFFDRQTDLYINDSAVTLLFASWKPEEKRDAEALGKARKRLDVMYSMMERHFEKKAWVMGDKFTMADCAAAPGLAVASMMHPFEKFPNVISYWKRVQERPSYQAVRKEALPFWEKFVSRKA